MWRIHKTPSTCGKAARKGNLTKAMAERAIFTGDLTSLSGKTVKLAGSGKVVTLRPLTAIGPNASKSPRDKVLSLFVDGENAEFKALEPWKQIAVIVYLVQHHSKMNGWKPLNKRCWLLLESLPVPRKEITAFVKNCELVKNNANVFPKAVIEIVNDLLNMKLPRTKLPCTRDEQFAFSLQREWTKRMVGNSFFDLMLLPTSDETALTAEDLQQLRELSDKDQIVITGSVLIALSQEYPELRSFLAKLFTQLFDDFETILMTQKKLIDKIAFSGQVPFTGMSLRCFTMLTSFLGMENGPLIDNIMWYLKHPDQLAVPADFFPCSVFEKYPAFAKQIYDVLQTRFVQPHLGRYNTIEIIFGDKIKCTLTHVMDMKLSTFVWKVTKLTTPRYKGPSNFFDFLGSPDEYKVDAPVITKVEDSHITIQALVHPLK